MPQTGIARRHLFELAETIGFALANEREVDCCLCPVCFLVLPSLLEGDAPELPALKRDRPELWDACMRQLTCPRTPEARAQRGRALQHNIDNCSRRDIHREMIALHKGHHASDPLELLDYALWLSLCACLWGVDSSTGNLETVVSRSHAVEKRFASSEGSWPTRVDQLFPYGVERTVEVLVDACCSSLDPGPWWVLNAILNLARPKMWDVFLLEKNHARLVQALFRQILRGTEYTIDVPNGGETKSDPRRLRADTGRQIGMMLFETILCGPYSRPDDDMRFMRAHEAQFGRLYEIARVLLRRDPSSEDWRKISEYVARASPHRLMVCALVPDADVLRFVERSPRHAAVVGVLENALHAVAGEKNCAGPECTRTMLDGDAGRPGLSMCARCKVTRYCCKACQRRDWADGQPFPHKQLCPVFAALARFSGSGAMAKHHHEQHIDTGNVSDDDLRLAARWMLKSSGRNTDLLRARILRLLPALRKDLRDDVDNEDRSPSWESKDIVDELCSNARQLYDAAIAGIKSFHNATYAHANFPSEVWCIIWAFLEEDELVGVTHVCRAWRAISTDCASFWTNIRFWTTVHAARSSCKDGLCECPEEVQQTHNLHKVATWLGRSKGLRVTLDITVYPVFSEHSLAVQLAEIVRPHGHRITSTILEFGDVSFFVQFAQLVKRFDALEFLRLSRTTYLHGEHNTWPMTKLRLEELHIPQLREVRGYGDFWWNIPSQPTGPSFPVLERLRCDFRDAQTFYNCLRSCPSLLFLNTELKDLPASVQAPSTNIPDADLAPHLEELILDRMTAQWESLLSRVVLRQTLKRLTLRYNSYDAGTLFLPLASLSGAVDMRLTAKSCESTLEAEDEKGSSRHLEFGHGDAGASDMQSLGRMWGHLRGSVLRKLTISWALRGALLNTTLVAPRLSRITFVVKEPAGEHSDRGVEELLAHNDPSLAGRPDIPSLTSLKLVQRRYPDIRSNAKLSASAVNGLAAALSKCALSVQLVAVDLV
ncbi:hypothetical protein AURDEDRAFT_175985 [Auricularia subglabra TFB-10046 SS5]|nr:hypothetical protein AURDEDRAFT_175985 [Auricularia subglabra TFB-10046 SS5]